MLRVNGLFGWIRANDQRSLVLFAGFVVALQLAAALTLYLPLAGLDQAHAPFLNWGGYALRYVPLVALFGGAVFGLQMLWHTQSVRRLVAFRFVGHEDERSLCDIVEPLAIGMGLSAPYVGVIETPAMNAFACGIRRADAVVVVTRGLIDGLDDEELSAVVAHELAHIANGDIRLMAAANICLGMLRRLMMPKRKATHPLVEIASFPVLLFVMPPMFAAVVVLAFLSQLSVRGGHLVRALIGASREFVADAAAVEATQNPAALVSALTRIDGRSQIAGMPVGHDAMMIDGAASGAYATHPSIAQRIKAVVAVTGSMALIAPSRRDTRQVRARDDASGFGRRTPAASPEPTGSRLDAGDGRNWLGLNRAATISALIGLVAFVGFRTYQHRDPASIAAEFDPRPAVTMVTMISRNLTCGFAATAGYRFCPESTGKATTASLAREPGIIGQMAKQMADDEMMSFRSPAGVLRDGAPAARIAAEVAAKRCFVARSYTVGDFGLHPVAPADDKFSLDRWLESGDISATGVVNAAAAPDAALADYLKTRKERLQMAHEYFGEPGLLYAVRHFNEAHTAAMAILRSRMADPGYAASLDVASRAEMQLLAEAPDAFIPCEARRAS